jgi:hypothetical protein
MNDDTSSSDAVWRFQISPTYVLFVEDLTRLIFIQLTIQTMLHVTNPDRFEFGGEFLILIMFLAIAVTAYWLVFRRLVRFS